MTAASVAADRSGVANRSGPEQRARVALLTNFIAPYRREVFHEFGKLCGTLRIFVSVAMEEGRDWPACHDELPVVVQRSLRWRETSRHAHQFTDRLNIHFPYDTIPQLSRFAPDVIVSGELGLRTLQAWVYSRIRRSSRLIIWATISEVTEQNRGFARRAIRHFLLKSADAVLVNGDSGARYVLKHGASSNRIFRVPQAADLSGFLSLPSSRAASVRKRLLYCGRLVELKGLIPFFAVLGKWADAHREENFELWIAGDGPLRDELASFHLPDNVSLRMLGHIAYERLPEIYAQCGILVLPTLADEWGLVIVEALASGLPVLGSQYSQAVEELLEPGRTGWTFRTDHYDEAYSAIAQMFSTPCEEINGMAQRGRERVTGLTPAAMASQMAAAVDFVLAQHNVGSGASQGVTG